ncbi:MAG: PepSY domain-containing protein [Pseudomonadota bacterium]
MLSGVLRTRLLIALTVLALALPQGMAAKDRDKDCKRSQDCALDAFQSGEIRPLPEVLAVAKAKVPGEVVKVELKREDGIWIYEIKVLTPPGRRREVEINARTLDVIKVD